jgi:uncharacterized repeat protein (TIGR03803 family)
VRYLLTVLLLVLTSALPLSSQTFTTMFSFNKTDGWNPVGPLAQGLDGSLYGTTQGGGPQNQGTVFKITTKRMLTTIYNFCAQTNCPAGGNPYSALLLGTDGNFYGNTVYGGAKNYGTIFKITPQGKFTVLYHFCSLANCADGAAPVSKLVQGRDGYLYGTTSQGGGSNACFNGCGVAFKMSLSGVQTVLHSFCSEYNCADGAIPNAVIQATDGYLYGTTYGTAPNYGTLYRLTTGGTLTTLYTFCGVPRCSDGLQPLAGLVQANDGYLYGTTSSGGNDGTIPSAGTLFKASTNGTLTTIYKFCSQTNCTDGDGPRGSLIQATDGNFYGTTSGYGKMNGGTLFKFNPSGTLTVLHNFPDWDHEWTGVMQATDGNFYGTTADGAPNYYGSIFRELSGLSPFVETLPASGVVGAKITILGSNLTGTTAVTFNGKPATFTVVSATQISTFVPTGATTGLVNVKTPTRTLSSNVVFHVR